MIQEFLSRPPCSFGATELHPREAEFTFLGIPLATTSSGLRSPDQGPVNLRLASTLVDPLSLAQGKNFNRLEIADIGDLVVKDVELLKSQVATTFEQLGKLGSTPVVLGGEHTSTLYTAPACDPSVLLVLDAHLDMRESYLGRRVTNATWLKRYLEDFPDSRVVIIGFRAGDEEEVRTAVSSGIEVVPAHAVSDHAEWPFDEIGDERTYVSVDADVIDPSHVPHVANPVPGGLTPRQLVQLFRGLGGLNLVGLDFVELCSPSAKAASNAVFANCIWEILASLSDSDELGVSPELREHALFWEDQ